MPVDSTTTAALTCEFVAMRARTLKELRVAISRKIVHARSLYNPRRQDGPRSILLSSSTRRACAWTEAAQLQRCRPAHGGASFLISDHRAGAGDEVALNEFRHTQGNLRPVGFAVTRLRELTSGHARFLTRMTCPWFP